MIGRGILPAFNSRKTIAFVVVLGSLVAVYLGSHGILVQEEPIEDAGSLAAAGSSGVAEASGMPLVNRQEEDAEIAMTASYYGHSLAGLPTASGEPFDPEGHSAAHKSLPLGTNLLVKRGDESVRVTVNDRGPYVAGRELDLSVGAAREIGLTGPGKDQVKVVLL